jgi:hypothetical protein
MLLNLVMHPASSAPSQWLDPEITTAAALADSFALTPADLARFAHP